MAEVDVVATSSSRTALVDDGGAAVLLQALALYFLLLGLLFVRLAIITKPVESFHAELVQLVKAVGCSHHDRLAAHRVLLQLLYDRIEALDVAVGIGDVTVISSEGSGMAVQIQRPFQRLNFAVGLSTDLFWSELQKVSLGVQLHNNFIDL